MMSYGRDQRCHSLLAHECRQCQEFAFQSTVICVQTGMACKLERLSAMLTHELQNTTSYIQRESLVSERHNKKVEHTRLEERV